MTAPTVLRVGTRGSMLAMTQSRQAAEQLVAGSGAVVELVQVRTTGDVDRRPLTSIGGTGVFVTAVRQALLDGEVDVIVHSCKDLPTVPAEGIALACIPQREDPRDALVARHGYTLATLPQGARVGTGSPRRAAQLLRRRPDLDVVAIRGNIDTRIDRAHGEQADLDAVILAASGLRRAGRDGEITEHLEPEVMLPACAQGALAIECRAADAAAGSPLGAMLAAMDDPATRAAVTAERAVLRSLEAGCAAPVAAHAVAVPAGDSAAELTVKALVTSLDGRTILEGSVSQVIALGARPEVEAESPAWAAGAQLAVDLLAQGAGEVLAAARAEQQAASSEGQS